MEEATNRDYIDSDPIHTTFQKKCHLAIWIILWICVAIGFILLTAPFASAAEINPSVESQPFLCRYSITAWTCDFFKAGPTGPQGPEGKENMTMNMTITLPTTYYLHNATTTANSSTYHVMKRYYPTGAGDSNTTTLSEPNTDYLLAQFITDENDPNLQALPPGDRKWFTYVSTDSLITGDTHLQYKLYSYHTNGTKSLIYSFQGQNLYDTAITRMVDQYTLQSAYPMNTSDRFIMEYYANTTSAADRTVTMYWDDASHVSKIESPITPTGLQGPPGPAGTAINESYAYLPGRAGGQVLTGGTAANDDLILNGTSSSTKTSSYVILQPDGGKASIGTKTPSYVFHVVASPNGYTPITSFETVGSGYTGATRVSVKNQYAELFLQAYDAYAPGVLSKATSVFANSGSAMLIGSGSGVNTMIYANDRYINPDIIVYSSGIIRFASYGAGTATFDAGGNITSVSDAKAKTNIKSMDATNAIAKIKLLNPSCYHYSASSGLDTNNEYCGFITQNVKIAIPEAVKTKQDVKYEQKLKTKGKTEEENEYETVEIPLGTTTDSLDDRALIAVLVNALKEEDAKVTALEARVTALEKKLSESRI